ncbi:ATP-binding protein [Boudabousia marimammalium]|uniref:AAA family ATPase n=1 Tax=Boudabousia marimammalium TaxID=156892 RepID=A0A1Q5PLW7_9ACTO|nr:DUF4143 domain-containing protein [Boudabousia marimammalium]OKL48048.1 AAA family ATPase [Boudabousia marimammalium]
MKKYQKRIADHLLQKRLKSKGAVLIEGAKWCGKTTTALQQARSVQYMQDPASRRQNRALAALDPARLLQGDTPRLIDEWQNTPMLWDAVRFEVDRRGDFGQFILTGSAVPTTLDEGAHTGTGRIARMTMRPMSLYESEESSGEVSLQGMFSDPSSVSGRNGLRLDDMAHLICRGGWPLSLGQDEDVALQQAIDYFDSVVNADVNRVDGVQRDPRRATRIMRSYARHIGTSASLQRIIDDTSPNESQQMSAPTVNSYVGALKQIFVLEDVPAWNPNLRSKAAIRTVDTRYFVDPSIAAAALGAGPKDLIQDLETMGFLFENLCIRDLRVYAEHLDGQVFHYRDKYGLECDAVIHLRNGQYGLIEIKLGGEQSIEAGAKTLNKLASKIDTTKMPAPSFKMVLIAVGDYAYTREDGVCVVPVASLKA